MVVSGPQEVARARALTACRVASDKFEKFEEAKVRRSLMRRRVLPLLPLLWVLTMSVQLAALNTAIRMFREYDRDGNGSIDRKEWLSIWKSLFGKEGKLDREDLQMAKRSMMKADKDRSGTVDLSEYLQWMKELGVL